MVGVADAGYGWDCGVVPSVDWADSYYEGYAVAEFELAWYGSV